MLFPVAGIEISPWIPPIVAFTISFFTSMGGVSGAFLLLPFQVSILGFTTPSVSATNQLFNIVAIPSGVYRYIKEGRMIWPLTLVVVIGTLPGVFIGAILRIQYLPDPRHFKLFAGLVLLYVGTKLIQNQFKPKKNQKNQIQAEEQFRQSVNEDSLRTRPHKHARASERQKVIVQKFSFSYIVYEFSGHTFKINIPGIMGLSFLVGIVGGIYGIGGGAIIAPFFVTFFGLPVFTIAGATLMGTFVTSVGGVLFYQLIAPYYPNQVVAPDYALGLLFGLGGFAGMYCGARFQKFVSARVIKWILVVCIFIPALKYIWCFFS